MASSLPLLRASIIETAVLGARNAGINVKRYLELAGLPDLAWGEENPHQALPLVTAMDFLELVARMEGFPLFGIHAALQRPLAAIRSLHLDLVDCANLHQVLSRFMERARRQGTTADYHLEYENEQVWLLHRPSLPRANALQADLYILAGMIEAVRLVAGPQWRPPKILLSARFSRHVAQSEYFGCDTIRFDQACRGIALPRQLLALENPPQPPQAKQTPDLPDPFPRSGLADRLQAIIPAYLANSQLNETTLTRITGMSFRSLQRRLAREGKSYSRIVTNARQQMAEQLLRENSKKLAEIARQLGYSNLPNFTRAFRRWSGITPSEYRQLHLAGHRVSITPSA
jgi:AraC-like DNA-binding protein